MDYIEWGENLPPDRVNFAEYMDSAAQQEWMEKMNPGYILHQIHREDYQDLLNGIYFLLKVR